MGTYGIRIHPELVVCKDFTVGEAAEYKRVHANTIRRWIETGLIEAYRVGPRLIRIPRASLDKLDTPLGVQ